VSHLLGCLAFTFAQEGGYQCDPADGGNWTGGRLYVGALVGTNRGISAPVLCHWRAPDDVQAADMQALGVDEATAIAAALFGNPIRVEDLPPGIDLMTFEAAWGCGVRTGCRILQGAVGAAADGFVGPATIAATRRCWPEKVVRDMDGALRNLYRSLPTWPVFGKGWIARADRRLVAALARVTAAAA
jgi:lysozyme family protein